MGTERLDTDDLIADESAAVWDAIAARVEAKGQELYVKALGGPASPNPER